MRQTPDDMKLTLIDVKRNELTPYNGLPHLTQPVITEPHKALDALKDMVNLMEQRYRLMEKNKWRIIPDNYAKHLIVIDEFADLILQNKVQLY